MSSEDRTHVKSKRKYSAIFEINKKMQKVEAEAKVKLDDLFLETCAYHLPFLKRIPLERVSHRFSNNLFATYVNSRVSLEITSSEEDNKEEDNNADKKEIIKYSFLDGAHKQKNSLLHVHENQLRNGLMFLFAHFKRYRQLKIDYLKPKMHLVMQEVFIIVSQQEYNPVEMHELAFTNYCGLAQPYTQLIVHFSSLIKKIQVICRGHMQPSEEAFKIWKAIRMCTNLRSLSYTFYPKGSYVSAPGLLECLQTLKLRSFHSNVSLITNRWLCEAFSLNDQLRVLVVTIDERQLFLDPLVKQLMSRLCKFGMTWTWDSSDVTDEEIAALKMLLRSLRDNCSIDIVGFTSTVLILDEIIFWLKIAHQTSKTVRLNFDRSLPRYHYTKQKSAVTTIMTSHQINGIEIEQYGDELNCGNGTVILKGMKSGG